MKIIGVYISIFFGICCMGYAQVQTGAISIYNLCGNNGVDGGACDLSSMYSVFSPMTLPGATTYASNCGGTNASPGGCTGTTANSHIQAYISVWIPATCVVDIVTEYGAPYNVNNNCVDSRMEANNVSNRIDALCINSGSAPSISAATPVALADCNNAKTAVAANIGICAAGAAGINTSTLNGGATGLNAAPASSVCWVTGGTGNANVTCTAAGFSGGGGGNWVTLWYLSNRGDEIMTYTITPTAGSCAGIGVIVLPIELVNFAAWKTSSDIQLGWTTASESNNNYFTVEYSLNGINFIPYKEIKGAGNSSEEKKYSCDFNEDTGNEIPYFRLKQVDYNGNFSYSHIIRSGTSYGALKNLGLNLKTYYNAGIDKIAGKFHLDFPQFVKIALYDMTGREINSLNGQYDEGDNEVLIQAPETTGIYFLVYEDENNAPVHKKIIISR